MNYGNRFESNHDPEEESWYHKAKDKVDEFIENIDPSLRVTVDVREVNYTQGEKDGEKRNKPVLLFYNPINGIQWTMDVKESDEYLVDKFEKAVRKVYLEKLRDLNG